MRRPLVLIFLCFSTGCVIGWYGRNSMSAVLIGIIFMFCMLFWMDRLRNENNRTVYCVVLISLLAGLISMTAELSREEPLLSFLDREATVTGKIVSEKKTQYGRTLVVCPLNEESMGNRGWTRRRLWITVDEDGNEEELETGTMVGWKVRITGTVRKPSRPDNPGGFDQELYLRTLGAQVMIETDEDGITVLNPDTSSSAAFREFLVKKWSPIMGEGSCGGLMGLLFGTSDLMEDETLDAFQKIGLGHLLAVSGLHVGLAYGAVQKLMGDRGKTVPAQLLCGLTAVGYAALAGFSSSASRAALMIVIHGIGRTLYRPYDMATSASLAGILILTRQPCQIMSNGFQLSMLAAFGLACVLPRISYGLEMAADRKRSHGLRWIALNGSPMIAIQMVMGPVCARRFHCLSLWSLALNPFCIAGSGLLIPLAMGVALMTMIMEMKFSVFIPFQPLFEKSVRLIGAVMDGMMNLGELVSEFPGTFVTAGFPPGLMMLYYLGLFTWSSESFYLLLRNKKRAEAAGWVIGIIVFSHLLPWWTGAASKPALFSYQDYPIVFLDVGQGDCIHIQTPGGNNVLIDGGGSSFRNVGEEILAPYLLHRGVKTIDLALATHLHMDHFQGLTEAHNMVKIKQFGTYEANRLRENEVLSQFVDKNDAGVPEIIYLREGSMIHLDEEVWIEVLSPPKRSNNEYEKLVKDDSDENDSCLIFLIHYGELELLVTGDMGFEGEQELLSKEIDISAEILKVGHHGSRYSTSAEFLRTVDPKLGVISVGTNYFGHPSDRVIELLEKNDIIIGRTDLDGALIVKRIVPNQADIIGGNGESQWRIDLRENQ